MPVVQKPLPSLPPTYSPLPCFIDGVKYIVKYFCNFCQIPLLGVVSVMFSRYILCNGQFVIKLVRGTITRYYCQDLVPESQISVDTAKLPKWVNISQNIGEHFTKHCPTKYFNLRKAPHLKQSFRALHNRSPSLKIPKFDPNLLFTISNYFQSI